MSFDKIIQEIREVSKKLLEEKTVDTVLAYTEGGINGLQIPFFASKPEDAEKIVWGNRCYQNLAPYLHGQKQKIAILAKPCDVRAIVQYIIEQQVSRENVYIIGVDCGGMVDENGDCRPGCGDCNVHTPPLYDTYIKDENVDSAAGKAKDSEGEDLARNLEKLQKEIDKCILCYSCRQACYGCYCKNCFVERDMPDWQPAEIDAGTKMTFHLGRAMHLSGRCVECGSCEAACASGVNVRYIIKEVTNFISDMYDYRSGMNLEDTPAMLTHTFEDKEVGFLGGEAHA